MIGAEVVEIKRTLDGRESRFPCTLLDRAPGWAALRYVLPRPAAVGTLALAAGTVTVGHYWPDRPYTAYHWLDAGGRTLGVYLNAAADVVLAPAEVRWLDLALDVLVTAAGGVEILDDDEARRAPAWAQPAIARARAALVPHAPAVASEVRRLSEGLAAAAWEGNRR
jgi:predicted RNA-binding protein associated with RNAse of E/G family